MTPEQRQVIMQEINRIDDNSPEGNARVQELLTLINYNEPRRVVKHADLERVSPESIFRSGCPHCKIGILLVGRHARTFELLAEDRCILCGQLFEYSDIEEMRQKERPHVPIPTDDPAKV